MDMCGLCGFQNASGVNGSSAPVEHGSRVRLASTDVGICRSWAHGDNGPTVFINNKWVSSCRYAYENKKITMCEIRINKIIVESIFYYRNSTYPSYSVLHISYQ